MGLRGPAPTPTPILKARGSWRADLNPGEVQFDTTAPTCPAWLNREAKAEWKRQAKQLQSANLLQVVDRAALAIYCQAWGEFVQACEQIKDRIEGAKGEMPLDAVGRLIKIKNEAGDRVLKLAAQFGFTPSARARLRATEPTKQEKPDSGKARFFA